MEQSVVKYSMQLSMLNFLYSRNMVSKKEYEKIFEAVKYSVSMGMKPSR